MVENLTFVSKVVSLFPTWAVFCSYLLVITFLKTSYAVKINLWQRQWMLSAQKIVSNDGRALLILIKEISIIILIKIQHRKSSKCKIFFVKMDSI